jgi:hypothetical protein
MSTPILDLQELGALMGLDAEIEEDLEELEVLLSYGGTGRHH